MNRRAAPFPFLTMFQNGPRRPGWRSAKSFQKQKRFSSAAHNPRALDSCGPFRRLTNEKGKGANPKARPFAALYCLPLVGPELHEKFGVDKTS